MIYSIHTAGIIPKFCVNCSEINDDEKSTFMVIKLFKNTVTCLRNSEFNTAFLW